MEQTASKTQGGLFTSTHDNDGRYVPVRERTWEWWPHRVPRETRKH